MRDSIGGIPVIVIVTLFIVIALGYVAFNVNYTKAFRMKNKAIDLFEDFYGAERCKSNGRCTAKLKDYAESIGYNPGKLDCSHIPGADNVVGLVCYTTGTYDTYTAEERKTLGIVDEGQGTFYNKVYAMINIDIPIIKNMVMTMDTFYVSGTTSSIKTINAHK